MKSITAGIVCALLIQFPIAFAYLIVPLILGFDSASDALGLVGFYFFWVTVIALPIIVVVGVPVFLWMHGRGIDSNRNMLIVGASMAVLFAAALTWPGYTTEGYSFSQGYYGVARDMVVDGVPTVWGWLKFCEDLTMFGIHGALGAAFFRMGWMMLHRPIPKADSGD